MSRTIPENRFLTSTDWQGYEKYLEAIGDSRVRATYDRGALELMTPSHQHENRKSVLGRFVETLMAELAVDFEFGGSTTFRSQRVDKGLEPDECYWIQSYEQVREMQGWDADRYPPPDLAIEVEISRSVLDRMGIYASLQVPEIWRSREDGAIEFRHRTPSGEYAARPVSRAFPWLESSAVQSLLESCRGMSGSAKIRAFRAWASEQPKP